MRINTLKYLPFIKKIFLILAFTFLVYFISKNNKEIYSLLSQGNKKLLLLSILCWCSVNYISPLFTKFALSIINVRIKYAILLSIFLKQLPAKYIPGGIWHTVARYTIYKQHGVKEKQLSFLFIYETLLPVLIAASIGYSLYFNNLFSGKIIGYISITLILGSCLSIIIGNIINQNQLVNNAAAILTTFIFWLIASVAFICYINAFTLTDTNNSQTVGAYLIGWASGNLALFSPQGLGVAEAVTTTLIEPKMNFGTSISIIFGFRLVITLADIISTASFYLLDKIKPKLEH